MQKKKYLFSVVFMVVFLWAPVAFAFGPMGPLMVGLKQFQTSAGIGYLRGNTDVKSKMAKRTYGGSFLNIIKGPIDGATGKVSKDLKQDSLSSGYKGVQIDITKNMACNIGFKDADRGFALGTSLIYKF